MRKEMYIIRGSKGEDYEHFTDRVIRTARATVELIKPEALKVTVTTGPPPRFSVIPFKKSKIAVISIYRIGNTSIDLLKFTEGFAGAFKVEEAIPVMYEKNWEDGKATPGACMLTLFHRKPSIDYDTFLKRWHYGHTPLSLKIHPLSNYNRNVVVQKICDRVEWWDGIVEEQTRTRSELLNPFKFFGSGLDVAGNMLAVYRDTKSFLDYKTIETFVATEYHLVSHAVYIPEIASQSK
jgi:hypothetical protein